MSLLLSLNTYSPPTSSVWMTPNFIWYPMGILLAVLLGAG